MTEQSEKRGRRILLVEDHSDTLRMMERVLRGRGHDVTPAATRAAALARLTAAAALAAGGEPFDLLVCDVGLPDGDGCDVVRAFRAACPAGGAIVLSGFGMADEIDRATAAGAHRVLVKPNDFRELHAAIAELA
ncbi:MAG TPA: response regulator [Tepidisphaeraceae bacterium]|nr:response regulator [Tepidisphaeraceae bacterium]